MIGIYKITNNINKKIYIGKSENIKNRWKAYHLPSERKNKKQPIHSAIDKYGIHNFSFEVVEECESSVLNEKEIYWINYFDSYNKGYNATLGGDGASGSYNGNSKINEENAKQIKVMLKQGYSVTNISRALNISYNIVYDIKRNKTWNSILINEEVESVEGIQKRKSSFKKINEEIKQEIISLKNSGKTIPEIMDILNLNGIVSKSNLYGIVRRNK